MRRELVEGFKSLVRPVAKHRFLVERAKYLGSRILSGQEGNDRLSALLHHPGAAGKIGGTEMKLCRVYLRRRDHTDVCHDFGHYAWWARVGSGIYPTDPVTLSRFCREYLPTLGCIDLLGVWFNFGEAAARRRYVPKAELCRIAALEPFYHERPWSAQLAGKRVVVVTPFEKSIRSQYARRQQVWSRKPDVLPEFDLRIIRCPQLAGIVEQTEYPDWFAGRDALLAQLTAAAPFDVAIVGAGAWSIPLVERAKSLGAFGIHMGGALQLLFGIMGARWDNNQQIGAVRNEFWIRPADEERPKNFRLVENGTYW